MTVHDQLIKSIEKLFRLKGECHFTLVEELGLSEMSLKQIDYIRRFNRQEGVTTTEVAEQLGLSKPTVTEMVKKFKKMDCVYKQSCPNDGRVHYVKLTEKGQRIADLEQLTIERLSSRLNERLSQEDLMVLSSILEKLE